MDEKVLSQSTRFSAVGLCLTAIRIWQWGSSFFVYASFSILYRHIQRNRLGADDRMRSVVLLGLVSLVYSTLVICCVHVFRALRLRIWRVFAVVSLPGDLTMMGMCLAKITILAFSGLPADCHGLTRDDYGGNDLVRQPADGYGTIRFGSWSTAMTGELDGLCTYPRTVYGLSAVAIFSYTFSILFSVLYIQQQGAATDIDNEKAGQEQQGSPGPSLRSLGDRMQEPSILDLDTAESRPPSPARSSPHRIPPRPSSPPQGSICSTRSNRAPSTGSQAWSISLSSEEGSTSWGAITPASDAESVRSGSSLPPPPLPGVPPPPRRRWSTSTSSSYNADAFVVTDGFRPAADAAGEPPAYSSRPGSLYHEPMKYAAGLGMPGTPKP